jgi:hypothetical protein
LTDKLTTYASRLKTQLYWWLSKRRKFIINDEYEIELLHIDREHESVKIRVTNLKNEGINNANN